MVYRPPFIKQLDGSRFAGQNCTLAATCMAIIRDRRGSDPPGTARWYPTPSQLRVWTGDTSGGTNLNQADRVAEVYYGVNLDVRMGITWPTFRWQIKIGRGAVLQGSYEAWVGTKLRGSYTFRGNHALYVNEVRWNTTSRTWEYLVYDPLWDGRYSEILKGPQWVSEYWLKKFAGYLAITSTRRVGVGYAWAAFTRDTEPVASAVKLRAGAKLVNPPVTVYSAYDGTNVRYGPWITSAVLSKLPLNGSFRVYQNFPKGASVGGDPTWYGDDTGKRWVARKGVRNRRS